MTVQAFPLGQVDFDQDVMYRLLDELFSVGVVGATDLQVLQRAAGANLSVDVDVGAALVTYTNGGKRQVNNDTRDNSGTVGAVGANWISTFAAAHATLPRIDRVVILVRDQNFGDSSNRAWFDVIDGTPTAAATLVNLNGAAAVPANALLLANVLVAAAATTIPTANIDTTVRVRAKVAQGSALPGDGAGSTTNFLRADATWAAPPAGGATVATTVAGLGTASDGKVGQIRAGSTPFDFIKIIYDATYGKWVSEQFQLYNQTSNSSGNATGNAYQGSAASQYATFVYGAMVTAGLAIQFRALYWLTSSAADGTIFGIVQLNTVDAPDTETAVAQTNTELSTAGVVTATLLVPGWAALTATTSRAYAYCQMQYKKTGGTGTVTLVNGSTVFGRWVA